MCYSKEVQLISAAVILSSAAYYYLYYSRKYRNSRKGWLTPFLRSSMLVFLCIGLHQLFEFLALVTGSQAIYKTGLIISVCAAYFLLQSLEALSNKGLHSRLALIPIALVSVQILLSRMDFSEAGFYLRHQSAFFWAATWLFLFIYWHICAFKTYADIKDDKSRKTLLIYLLAIADVSFILSAAYVLVGHFLFSVNVCTDSPSIWCTFYVIQSFLIPFLLVRSDRAFRRVSSRRTLSARQTITYLVLSLLILIALVLTLPLFHCLTWKFVFP